MQVPGDLKYTKDHEWVKVEGGSALVGITEFAQSQLGDIVFVDLPAIGKTVKQGGTLCAVESTKAASDVYAPIGGAVAEVNNALSQKPELINSSPFKEGWIVKLNNLSAGDLAGLMTAEQYTALLGNQA
jgi:glycine cleavage system H protein